MKIALIGYGKMGKAIEQLAIKNDHEIVLKITTENPHDLNRENILNADVAIEFSRPETAFENISFCINNGIPVVCGTTGWLEKMGAAKQLNAQKNGAFFYASNFSIGVNIFFAVNKFLASLMESQQQYDVKMEEIHHTQKLDHPSGTAVTLAQGILSNLSRKNDWTGILQESETTEVSFDQNTLGIVSKRVENISGSHFIKWDSKIDSIEINHVAHSREGFASGALAAAIWLVGKEGYFEMSDMLGF